MDFENQESLIKELSLKVYKLIEWGFDDRDILENAFNEVDKLRTEMSYYLDHFND